jgi:LPS export ABC transporter protein LptC
MVTPRYIRFALVLLVTMVTIGIVAAISFKGSHTAQPEPVSKQLPQNIDVALHKVRFVDMRDGASVWELVADRAEYDKNGDVAYLSNVHMLFAKTRTNGTITVTSARGEYANTGKKVRLRGNVHVVTESGMQFDTQSLDYEGENSRFRTTERVDFHHERLSLAAVGMELDVKAEKTRFFKTVDAVIEVPAER